MSPSMKKLAILMASILMLVTVVYIVYDYFDSRNYGYIEVTATDIDPVKDWVFAGNTRLFPEGEPITYTAKVRPADEVEVSLTGPTIKKETKIVKVSRGETSEISFNGQPVTVKEILENEGLSKQAKDLITHEYFGDSSQWLVTVSSLGNEGIYTEKCVSIFNTNSRRWQKLVCDEKVDGNLDALVGAPFDLLDYVERIAGD